MNLIMEGEVVLGDKKARLFGFPTMNIRNVLKVASGIYAGFAYIEDKKYESVMYVGDSRKDILEAHAFDFDKNVYGHTIKIELVEKIREDKAGLGLEELKALIKSDSEKAKEILKHTCLQE